MLMQPDPRLAAAALALMVSACASSDAALDAQMQDRHTRPPPSYRSVLFPGEYHYTSGEVLLWRLPNF
jgi:hypothetical protein